MKTVVEGGSVEGSERESIKRMEKKRNPKWSRDELLLVLDLYLQNPKSPLFNVNYIYRLTTIRIPFSWLNVRSL
jgi:hypothetical protein